MKLKKKILFFVTEDWYFCWHWMSFASAAQTIGYQVTVITQVQEYREKILDAGFKLIPIELSRQGLNPLKEWRLLRKLISIYRTEEPTLVHQVAMKPIIYGSIAAHLSGVRGMVNAVAGLGYIFSTSSLKTRILRPLIRLTFRLLTATTSCRFVFQNPDDAKIIFPSGDQSKVKIIKGVGVDIERYLPIPEPEEIPLVLLAARLIWDKGLLEFTNAARSLLKQGIQARFVIVGEPDEGNPGTVQRSQLEAWVREGIIEWWGYQDNMPQVYASCNIFCLPTSYGEGLPTVLLEAAASGRALITTDAPGCREIVRDDVNGYLVPIKDSESLADSMKKLILDPGKRRRMGQRGREIVEAEFSMKQVIANTQAVYSELLEGIKSGSA